MNAPPLISVSIDYLRGSVTPFKLPFEKSKKLTIIYGENGTGKSTVSEAFDLLGNGTVGSLSTRGLGSTRKYWPSIGRMAADVKVTLETTAGACSAMLVKHDVVVTGPAPRPQVAVLRRSQILQLIKAEPAERYEAISRFVDVSAVEASESSLRKLTIDKAREYDTAMLRVSENRDAIERFWHEAGKPGSTAIDWAQQEVQKDRSQPNMRKVAIDDLIGWWDRLAEHPQKIAGLVNQFNAAQIAQQQARNELGTVKDSVAIDYLEVVDILKAAHAHFVEHPNPTVCPLCESSDKVAGLAEKVNRRIQSQGLYGKLESAKNSLLAKDAAVHEAQKRLDEANRVAADDAAAFAAFCNGAQALTDVEMPAFPVPADMADLAIWIARHQDQCSQWIITGEVCVADKKFIGTLRTSLDALAGNERRAKELKALLPRLNEVLDLVKLERKKFTDDILSAISARVRELYEAIHPGEGLNKIGLALDESKRASLEIAAEFGGKQDAPPQAYFSDSHLDTLGLCVFLALAEREAPEDKLLVMDDVLGSVDEPHVERIIEMIYSATAKFRHCIVTTHYGPWRHKYRWGWLKNGQCQFVELSRWSLLKGISHSRSIPEANRLRAMLAEASPDHQAICAKAGVILEAVLDFLTQLYECSVPRKATGAYTLGDLLPAIGTRLRKALRVEHRLEDAHGRVTYDSRLLEPHLIELARIAHVRNVTGCHFNALSFDLMDSDTIAFGTEVLALADALVDHEAGWPRNGRSGSYWATAGETRRLHPLSKPS